MMGVSQAEFARTIGVNRSHVTRLKQAGRLVLEEDGSIDVDASRTRIAETADPNRDDVAARHAAARGDADASETAQEPAGEAIGAPETYQAARAKKERFLALQAELDYLRSASLVIDRRAVDHAVAGVVTLFRQALENLPHRTAPSLLGQSLDDIRATLRDEIRGALAELERELTARLAEIGRGQD